MASYLLLPKTERCATEKREQIDGTAVYVSRIEAKRHSKYHNTPHAMEQTTSQMNAYNKIMAACDLSPYALQVLKHAARLSRRLDSELLIVKIIDQKEIDSVKAFFSKISEDRDHMTIDDYLKDMKKERYHEIQNLMRSIPTKDLKYKILIRTGRPCMELIKIVHEKDVNMVVMGTKGKSNWRGLFFGATAERMFRLCPVPLLSVRLQKH